MNRFFSTKKFFLLISSPFKNNKKEPRKEAQWEHWNTKTSVQVVLEVHRSTFKHLDWQLMGFHDFSKLDLRMMHSGSKQTLDCGKSFRTPWISLPDNRVTILLVTRKRCSSSSSHKGKLNNHILLFWLPNQNADWKIMFASVSVCAEKSWKRVMKQVEFNSIERDSNVELKSIKLLGKLDEESIFPAVAVQLKPDEKTRNFKPIERCGREFNPRF